MKILKRSFEKDGGGTVTLLPDEDEDMWHVFNLVSGDAGDRIKAPTVRKVQHETASGGTDSQRVRVTLEVVVEHVDFDAVSCKLRLRGKNILENPHVKLGSYHTIELEKNRKFTLTKQCFDAMHIEVLREAADPTAKAELAAVVMQEGLAHICLVTSAMTHVRQKVEQSVPRKVCSASSCVVTPSHCLGAFGLASCLLAAQSAWVLAIRLADTGQSRDFRARQGDGRILRKNVRRDAAAHRFWEDQVCGAGLPWLRQG
jgi:hypothetical protein